MTDLFFYGTLRHIPLLEVVLGASSGDLTFEDDMLPGYAVSSMSGGLYPTISQSDAQAAEGLLVRNLTPEDLERLNFYEGSFAYDLRSVTLASGAAGQVYFPQDMASQGDGPWVLADWVTKFGEISVRAAHEVMGYRGTRSREQVSEMFPVIRARAAANLRAQRSLHGTQAFPGKVVIEERVRSYSDFYALDDFKLRHEQFDGGMSETLDRAVLVGADAALVLPYDPVQDRVLLVEQVRLGPIGRGDRALWQLEPVAGRIDPGEDPEQAARREALEEAGLTLGALEKIAEVYPSPGTSTEFYYIYLGLADLSGGIDGGGGLAEEHEDIRSHLMSFDALMTMVARFDVANAPLALAAYYLSHHRDRLRSGGGAATPEAET